MDEISLNDILKIIYRRRVIVLATILIALMAAGIIFNLGSDNEYEYAATIYTKGDYLSSNEKKSEDTIITELQIGEQLTKDYVNFLDSQYVMKNIQVKLRDKYDNFKSYSDNDLNGFIKGKINIKAKGEESRFLVVSAMDKNPELAKDIVEFAAEELKKSAVEILGVGSVNVVDISQVSESNSTMKNAGVAFAVTMVLGILITFITEFMDDSLNSINLLENKFGIKLIGVVPEY